MQVREVRDDERAWLRATLEQHWGDEIAVSRGRVWTLHELPALVAVDDSGERVGVATYIVEDAVAELVSIDALRTVRASGDSCSTPLPRGRVLRAPSGCW